MTRSGLRIASPGRVGKYRKRSVCCSCVHRLAQRQPDINRYSLCYPSATARHLKLMRNFVYQLHLILGILVSIPVLAWALSGFLYALPNTVEGGTVENIDAGRVKVTPGEAMAEANALAGRDLPTTAMTLLMKDGRPQYQSVGGLGAESIFIDAENGVASFSKPPTWKTRFFREAHFYFFAGSWQVTLLLIFSALAALSAATGIYLNLVYWTRKFRGPGHRQYGRYIRN